MKQLTLLFFFLAVFSLQAQEKPNFIFILTDDQQTGLMGFEGNPIVKTPNLDRLAAEGIYFSNTHITSAICTPSRISILLGQYERKHGVNFNSGTSVAPEAWALSYPVVMRDNGYYTGYIGKNHAPIGDGGYESGLMDESFDYWYAGHGHLSFYPKKRHYIFKNAKSDTQVEVIEEGVDDFFSNEHRLEGALHFLDERPEDKPFCLSICFNLPHGSSTGTMQQLPSDPEIYKSLYRDQDIELPKHYLARKDISTPKLPVEIHFANERQAGYNYVDKPETNIERMTRQMQAMTGIDQMFGRLQEQLKKQGLDKNTIIVFSSDHGLFMGEFGLGGKALCYERVTKVPMMIYDPTAPKRHRRKQLNHLVQSIDVAPTLLDYAGIKIPETMQGVSLRPLLQGEEVEIRDYAYTENLWSTQFGNPRCEAVQDREWKYIRYYKNENLKASAKIEAAKSLGIPVNEMLYQVHDPDIALYRTFAEGPLQGEAAVYEELFHLAVDPDETTNLATQAGHQAKLEEMRAVWAEKIRLARGTGQPKVLRYTDDMVKPE